MTPFGKIALALLAAALGSALVTTPFVHDAFCWKHPNDPRYVLEACVKELRHETAQVGITWNEYKSNNNPMPTGLPDRMIELLRSQMPDSAVGVDSVFNGSGIWAAINPKILQHQERLTTWDPDSCGSITLFWIMQDDAMFVFFLPDSIDAEGLGAWGQCNRGNANLLTGFVVPFANGVDARANIAQGESLLTAIARAAVRDGGIPYDAAMWRNGFRHRALFHETHRREERAAAILCIILVAGTLVAFWTRATLRTYGTAHADFARIRHGFEHAPRPSLWRCCTAASSDAFLAAYRNKLREAWRERQRRSAEERCETEALRLREDREHSFQERFATVQDLAELVDDEALWSLLAKANDASRALPERETALRTAYALLDKLTKPTPKLVAPERPWRTAYGRKRRRQSTVVSEPEIATATSVERRGIGSDDLDDLLDIRRLLPSAVNHDHAVAIVLWGLLSPGAKRGPRFEECYTREEILRPLTAKHVPRFDRRAYDRALEWLIRNGVVHIQKKKHGRPMYSLNVHVAEATEEGRPIVARILAFQKGLTAMTT